jgi:hypothetical protein
MKKTEKKSKNNEKKAAKNSKSSKKLPQKTNTRLYKVKPPPKNH